MPLLYWWPNDFNGTLESKSWVLSCNYLLQPPLLVNMSSWGCPPVLSFHSPVTERSDLSSSSLWGTSGDLAPLASSP